jgi:hypothetical protein
VFSKMNQVIAQDHFARNGYTFRQGKSLSIQVDDYFLYVDAPDAFFSAHESEIMAVQGTTAVKGNEYDNVKATIEAEEAAVATGIGMFD